MKKKAGIERKKSLWGFIFTIPAIIFFAVFSFYPIINAFITSFYKKDLLSLSKPKFIGLGNYKYLLHSESFWNSVKATAIFTAGTFIPLVVVSLILAVFISSRKRFQKFFQMSYYSPALLSSVVAATIWLLMFDPRGLANQFLNFILNTSGRDYKWLTSSGMLRLSTIIVYFWKYIGYFTVIFVTGIASIPQSINEAARIDGANRWQVFTRITLPLIKPTTLLVSIMAMTQCLKTFSTQYLFTQSGAPLKPIDVITLNIYNTAIRDHQIGRASAMSIILFVIILTLTIVQFRVSKSEEVEY
ncbi:MAG: sugar ABC transporter permease [Defluviitoga tunisiensis]|jgi:multiple sugar transport system permease protein|nr:sugar ABC transporter permease [Defluviitoga tunisiensis]MDD3600252.1 sugar ABC transporter permease [Defluviitoga tunisiensis]MDY0379791.1 sugar ABC transporter permease [Defluviitoga tunisiensis]HHV01340.1 sugar ABC transporter permease [Defluviitoga tunisiensis]HOB54880.1 sugar ABC transporter permease [Defluviitoga tunisiensis]HOK15532.1 sugar ABC transporter permease [Defluviitoga tunisiensis]